MDKQFGKLTVLETTGRMDKFGSEFYWCRCACGNITILSQEELESGFIEDCGCGCSQPDSAKPTQQETPQEKNQTEPSSEKPFKKVFVESFASRWYGLDGVATNPKHIRPWPEIYRRKHT